GSGEARQPGGRLELEEVAQRRIQRLGHGHLIRGAAEPVRQEPSSATDHRHRHHDSPDSTPRRSATYEGALSVRALTAVRRRAARAKLSSRPRPTSRGGTRRSFEPAGPSLAGGLPLFPYSTYSTRKSDVKNRGVRRDGAKPGEMCVWMHNGQRPAALSLVLAAARRS